MKRGHLGYIISFFILIVILYTSFPAIQEICIFLSYNALFFIDNSFSFSKGINPLFAWAIIFFLFGIIIGLAKSVSIFQLHKIFYLYSFLWIILLLFLINTCSHPLKYNSSREVREEMLWSNLNKQKSYSISTLYINEFPEGKYISEVKLIQESTLWDSASVSKSSQVWKLYCDKFKSSTRFSQAVYKYDNKLWTELAKENTASAYSRYLKEFPKGLHAKIAQAKLDKYLDQNKETDPQEKSLDINQPQLDSIQSYTVSDSVTNIDTIADEKKIVNSEDDHTNTSSEYYGKLDLSGGRKYEGYIRNELPNGDGTEILLDKTTLKGYYINGNREGEFICTKVDGSTEKLLFKSGVRMGNSYGSTKTSSISYKNGLKMNGNELFQGQDEDKFSDGTSLSGNYVDGKRQGDFIFTRKDGTKEKQVFKDGNRIK